MKIMDFVAWRPKREIDTMFLVVIQLFLRFAIDSNLKAENNSLTLTGYIFIKNAVIIQTFQYKKDTVHDSIFFFTLIVRLR